MQEGYGFQVAALLVFAGIVALEKLVDQRIGRRRAPEPPSRGQTIRLLGALGLLAGGILLGVMFR